MKKIISLIILLSFFFLFSCVKKRENYISDKNKTVIRFSVWGGDIEFKIWKEVIKNFESKYSNVKVKLEMLPGGNYKDKLQAMLASETAPDVFYTDHSSMFYGFVARDVLLPLDKYIKQDKDIDIKDFFPQALEMFRVKGKLYAFPKDLHTFALYYNKDVFDKSGIKYPDKSWNWNKFLEVSKKLTLKKNSGNHMLQYGFIWDPRYWVMLVYQNNGAIFNKDKSKCLIGDKKVIEAIDFLNYTIQNKISINPGTIKYRELNQMFMLGRVAMYISGVWVGAEFRNQNFNWGIATLPKGKCRATLLVGSGPVVYAKTKHVTAAYNFAKFIVNKKSQKLFAKLGVSIPTRKSIAYSKYFLGDDEQNMNVFIEQIKYGRTLEFDDFELGDEIMKEIVSPELDKVWFGNKNTKEACSVIEKGVNEFLSKYSKSYK